MSKIAIFDPYIETRGGGEKLALSMAAALAKAGHDVSIMCPDEPDFEGLGDYFGIDLSMISFLPYLERRRWWVEFVRRFPVLGRIYLMLVEREVADSVRAAGVDVFINNCYLSNAPSYAPIGIYNCMFPQLMVEDDEEDYGWPRRTWAGLIRALSRRMLGVDVMRPLDSYQGVISISQFTAEFVESRWRRSSELIYPPCDDMAVPGVDRRKVILQVGRFFADAKDSHHKRHDFLIDEFAKMTDLHEAGWELHIAGSMGEDAPSVAYVLKLMAKAKGLPIYLSPNASAAQLKELYNRSSIYWHATGFGTTSQSDPEKQEHFGMTTVEAMSAGSIPVVIDSAGQKETVGHGVSGFLWNSPEEMAAYTRLLASDSDLRDKLRVNAREASAAFHADAYEGHIVRYVDSVIESKAAVR